MNFLYRLLICFLAGAGAGLGTGFAGMSAAAVIGPLLITFLDMDQFTAVAIGLASDILASAVSAYTYHKNRNIDLRGGLLMMATVLAFTVVGSILASIAPKSTMSDLSILMTALLGLKFLLFPVNTTRESMEKISRKRKIAGSILCGVYIGLICGFVGAGGGMMMLLVLTTVLGYELKCAVGTSVFIMTFTALTGSVSHFTANYLSTGELPDFTVLGLCALFTLLWARIAAVLANKASTKTLNRVTGLVLLVTGAAVMTVNYINTGSIL